MKSNEHFAKRRAEIQMYKAGVDAGIRFASMKILEGVWHEDLENMVKRLMEEYHE